MKATLGSLNLSIVTAGSGRLHWSSPPLASAGPAAGCPAPKRWEIDLSIIAFLLRRTPWSKSALLALAVGVVPAACSAYPPASGDRALLALLAQAGVAPPPAPRPLDPTR